jgi:hypothetical protein
MLSAPPLVLVALDSSLRILHHSCVLKRVASQWLNNHSCCKYSIYTLNLPYPHMSLLVSLSFCKRVLSQWIIMNVQQSFMFQMHNGHSQNCQLTLSSFIFPCITSISFHLYIASGIVLVAYLLTTVDKRWLLVNFVHGKRCSHPLTHRFDCLHPLTFLIGRTSLAYMCTSHLFYQNGKRHCVSIKHRNTSVIITNHHC